MYFQAAVTSSDPADFGGLPTDHLQVSKVSDHIGLLPKIANEFGYGESNPELPRAMLVDDK